jgi:DNA-binding protein|tara:strand:+ start:813 stop:1208 length:396 start_codon:yes stop_codon:yes gene_type:complete
LKKDKFINQNLKHKPIETLLTIINIDNYNIKTTRRSANMDDNSIFIGGKPFMNYVTGVVMQFTTKNAEEVIVKARGKFISRAVDVAEVASKRFLEGTVSVRDIKIDSEEFKNNEGKDVRVSSMEIILEKNQ